jgi:hypothetical protein
MNTQLHLSFSLILLFPLLHHVIASDIDFSSIPDCAKAPCFPYHSSSIGCTELTKICFCNALAPLNCARSDCTGDAWYELEDWFSTQCPGQPKLVSFDPGIPLEARACVRTWIVPQRCNASITRNCFCRLDNAGNNVTEAMAECMKTDAEMPPEEAEVMANKLYRSTCVYSEDAGGEKRPEDEQEEVVPSPNKGPGGVSAEDIALFAGIPASFLTMLGVLYAIYKRCYQRVSVSSDIFSM